MELHRSTPVRPEPGCTPIPPPLPPGWRVEVATGADIAKAEQVEHDVFLASGYCEPSEHGRVTEYDPWRASSAFHVVITPAGDVVAVVRTILGDYDDLPVGKFAREVNAPPDPVLEYASLAIVPENRQSGLAEELYRAVFREALRSGALGLVAIGETWLVDLLNGVYDFPFRQLGPSHWYMGGDCFPMGLGVPEVVAHFVERQPEFLSWLTEEIDLRELPADSVRQTFARSSP